MTLIDVIGMVFLLFFFTDFKRILMTTRRRGRTAKACRSRLYPTRTRINRSRELKRAQIRPKLFVRYF